MGLQWMDTLSISSLLSHLACDGEHFDYGKARAAIFGCGDYFRPRSSHDRST